MSGIRKCNECGSINLTYDSHLGEVICNDCGLVIEEKMVDTGMDLQGKFDKGDKKGRGGAPISMPNVVRDEASRIYNYVLQRGLVRGRSMESVIAACLYAACRSYNIPRTLDEMATASDVERKEIGRTYRFIIRKLGIKVTQSSPKDYISRFSSLLKLSPKTQNDALKILKNAEDVELTSGRGPAGISAAALYVAALMNDEKKTQREVADIAGITEVTIRNRYKELIDKLDLETKIKQKEKEGSKKKKEAQIQIDE